MNLIERQFEFKSKIAVVGDSMLDEYYDVKSDRVSPEFPIPVLESIDGYPFKLALGGASNVCSQFSNFNFDISLFSLINEKIKYLATNLEINTEGCVFTRGIPIKKRFYSQGFPLCRMDIEGFGYKLNKESLADLQQKILRNFVSSGPFDVVVFSDYDKGLFFDIKNIIDLVDDNTITIVDPKRGPVDRWKGCTIIKPNAAEAWEISGKTDPKKQCEYFLSNTNCQAVIITNGGEGIFGNVMGNWFEYIPEVKINPRSVIGAGDCFVAFLAMCMAHSIDIKQAVKIAFDACSIYIQNTCNAPLYPYQIKSSKLVSWKSLAKRNFKLAFTNGCFDILHPGHLELFNFSKTKADKLVVAINSDRSVKSQNKKHELINNIDYRTSMVQALECVDFVIVFDEDTPYEAIKQIRPDVLVKGSDWPEPIGSDLVDEVFLFDKVGDYSTSGIIEKILFNG